MRAAWRRLMTGLLVVGLAATTHVSAGPQERDPDPRELYNEGLIDQAIAAAEADWQAANTAEAALVLARGLLERFRLRENSGDLIVARRLLDEIEVSGLSPRALLDWEVGVATTLFFNKRLGAAAVMFERLLDDSLLDGSERDRILDWWATAVDQVGLTQNRDGRLRTYGRMAERLQTELERNPRSAPVVYWRVVAARGLGDPEHAWHLAVAAWVRAPLTTDRRKLRDDVDRLVLQGVVPDLAVHRTGEAAHHRPTVRAMALLAAEWEELKAFWTGREEEG